MEDMAPKPWWASVTIISQGVIVLLSAIFAGISYWKHGDAMIAGAVFATFSAAAGAGIYGRVTATRTIGS